MCAATQPAPPSCPCAACRRYAEWWAHCRRHPAGHQLHFDSDDEGAGGVRNPIVSTVVYLTGETPVATVRRCVLQVHLPSRFKSHRVTSIWDSLPDWRGPHPPLDIVGRSALGV